MSFADDFRAIVVPRLKRGIDAQAFLLALAMDGDFADADDLGWSDAFAEIWQTARAFGASHLPPSVSADLEDWTQAALLRGLVAHEARLPSIKEQIAAASVADPVKHYSELAVGSSDPARMQWVFAAISPEYRAWLLAQRRAPVRAEDAHAD